jgi:molecular chaperone DnaK (HSP70)
MHDVKANQTDLYENQEPSRYIVGIDLGTTNCAAGFIDTHRKPFAVENFAVPQLTAPGETHHLDMLPSFHYEPAEGELRTEDLALPWSGEQHGVTGAFARDHGAAVPGRLVVSAKSWLSHGGVDRTAPLLPWHAAEDVEKLSPVAASARYLSHIRAAWNHARPDEPLERQDVVITAPASFDEVARELTVEAAARAGLPRVVLLEEPQAAFYAWIHRHGADWDRRVSAGQKILICDIGGGTTDFTLIHVRPADEGVRFHRIAVGDHLILGGDNLDLALAYLLEQKLGGKLAPRQFSALVRSCQKAKETLLGENPPESLTVNILSGGAALIGGAKQVTLTRAETEQALIEGFFPRVALSDKPSTRRSGFQEFGLPYAPDHAITRYLADFLTRHEQTAKNDEASAGRPDIVLFNGGLFLSPAVERRLLDVLAHWYSTPDAPWQPAVLHGDRPELAVARGAAYYGLVRRGIGVRIDAGLARSYYIGIEAEAGAKALCLAPAGLKEGESVDLTTPDFSLLIRQPVEFPLYASSVRTTDPAGALVAVEPETMLALPPIRTVLRSGKKSAADAIPVSLHARLTPIGTLDLWCSEKQGQRNWRLQFDVRSATRTDIEAHAGAGEAAGFVDTRTADACRAEIVKTFRTGAKAGPGPQGLVKRLESISDMSRHQWPPSLLRQCWEACMEVIDSRALDPVYEARWLNLAGFALRPGFGYAVDDWRVKQTWRLFHEKVAHPRNQACRAEWWIVWRRIAGGLTGGQQQALTAPLVQTVKAWSGGAEADRKRKSRAGRADSRIGMHELGEIWRLLASCEYLEPGVKSELGDAAIGFPSKRGAVSDIALWAVGRLGARIPLYGPLNLLVSADQASAWLSALTSAPPRGDNALFAVMQLARRTGDRYRDIDDQARTSALEYLQTHHAPDHFIALVREGGSLDQREQSMIFGESLPSGLKIG